VPKRNFLCYLGGKTLSAGVYSTVTTGLVKHYFGFCL
jgi:hypothetical protein